MNLVTVVRDAGVVGAGGAGFPTYAKIDTSADTVIANGAECEPLLYKDQILMEHHPGEIVGGLRRVMQHTGAARGLIAVKSKNKTAIRSLSVCLSDDVSIFEMDDVYPAGDEFEVVYHTTGQRIPAGGYPTEIGVVVQNVETLYNVNRAVDGKPVTHSMLTVHGRVRRPLTASFPLGTPYRDVLAAAGGATVDAFVLIDGGPMMGRVVTDLTTPVTKLTSGFVVLPADSKLALRKTQTEQAYRRFGKSACDQCSLCTEMCPRYLLGYPIQPHLVMRSLLTSGALSETLTHWAQACCGCNICTLWACPEELDPRNVCMTTKRDLEKQRRSLSLERLRQLATDVHPLKDYRSVPTARLARRLGLTGYAAEAPLEVDLAMPATVEISLQQHVGAPATPIVAAGDHVRAGDMIARAAAGQLSVPVHASVSGTVRSVAETIVIDRDVRPESGR